MSDLFMNELSKVPNAKTENNANTYSTSCNYLANFLFQAPSFRNSHEDAIVELFKAACAEDLHKAIVLLFYIRDIRGGLGERRIFRECLKELEESQPEIFKNLISIIPYCGRWDDIIEIWDSAHHPSVKVSIEELIITQLTADMKAEYPSLLAKWMPSLNAGKRSKEIAKDLIRALRVTPRQYRKMLSKLRKKIGIVEHQLSNQDFSSIDYSKVPSQAMKMYYHTFCEKDGERFEEYIDGLSKGKTKINADTLYPYQVVKNFQRKDSKFLDAQWKGLRDFGKVENTLVVADVSWSMFGMERVAPNPIDISLSLGLYMAERNSGFYKNKFITFSKTPELVILPDIDIKGKLNSMANSPWGYNTDLEAVFTLVLDTAIDNNIAQEELPENIIIVSDMEFDQATSVNDSKTFIQKMKDKFTNHGYEMPKLIFWNASTEASDNFPIQHNEVGILMSGFNASMLKSVLKSETPTTEKLIDELVSKDRYRLIWEKIEEVER